MKITAIKAQIKNPQQVSVFVDGSYSFSLSLDELVKYKVSSNSELTAGDIKKFKKISSDGKLRARALEWLLNRPHSIREFHDYLRRKKAEPEFIEELTSEFSKKGYLNDYKFSQWYVELKARKGMSNRGLRSELFKKGIAREVADEVLSEESDSEAARLKILIDKKIKLSKYKNDQQKLAKYLTTQGFDYQLVKQTLSVEFEED